MSGSSKPTYVHFNTNTSLSHAVLLIVSYRERERVQGQHSGWLKTLNLYLHFKVLHFNSICETASCNFAWILRSDWVNGCRKVLGSPKIFPPLSLSHIRIGAGNTRLRDPAIFDEKPGLLKHLHLFSFMFMFLAENV